MESRRQRDIKAGYIRTFWRKKRNKNSNIFPWECAVPVGLSVTAHINHGFHYGILFLLDKLVKYSWLSCGMGESPLHNPGHGL